jgi:hypothetical protein
VIYRWLKIDVSLSLAISGQVLISGKRERKIKIMSAESSLLAVLRSMKHLK